MKYAPKPWKFFGNHTGSVLDANGHVVCEVILAGVHLNDRRAAAEHIVQACNYFWELVESAKMLLDKHRTMSAHEFHHGADMEARTRLVIAVAKAEGKKFK